VRVIYKQYNLCQGDTSISEVVGDFTSFPRTLLGQWTVNGYIATPIWFNWITILSTIQQYSFNPATIPDGTYVIGFSANNVEYLIVINIGDTCRFYLPTTIGTCCSGYNIVWLNQYGGYESFLFTGKRIIFELNEGETSQFKTQNLTLKNSEIKNLYRAVVVNTGLIEKERLNNLESLRSSIQAWVYDEELPEYYNWEDRFTPIVIDRDSFVVNDTKEKVVDRSIRFLIAKEKVIQGQ
jgi:hypothetical protein